MKKVITILTVVLLCAMMVLPAYAAEPGFVPSVTYKEVPEVESATMGETDVSNALVITSIKGAQDKTTDIDQDTRDALINAYTDLRKEKVELPLDHEYVVLEMVDISFTNQEHETELNKDDVTVTLKFDLGVSKDVKVSVLTYNDGKWTEIKSVVNNGDGTVTCVFDHFCPVVFSVPAAQYEGPTETGDNSQIMLWVFMMGAALAGIVVLSVLYFRKGNRA